MDESITGPDRRTAKLPVLAQRLAFPFVLSVTLSLGCARTASLPTHVGYATGQVARSGHGMVVSGSAIASEIGSDILAGGGNAVDAAVATALALAVVEPTMSGLGGRTQVLIRSPDGQVFGIDGTTEVPSNAPPNDREDDAAYGYGTIGIPGTIAALAQAIQQYGTRSLSDVLQPAISLAADGFVLSDHEAARLATAADLLREFEGSRRYFLKSDGSPYAGGERLIQSDLAATMRAIAAGGPDIFYRGWIADSIAADVTRHGGFLTRADLQSYQAEPSLIVRGSYRGYDLAGSYLPASGATTIETLQILENFDVTERVGTAEWVSLVAQALLMSFEDRTADLGKTPEEQARRIVSKEWAETRAREAAASGQLPGASDRPESSEPEFTTHLSVADANGWLVALTQSIGPLMGSKVATPGLGFVYAATMGYLATSPGIRPWSSQSPLIVTRDGSPVLVLGAAGARRIISAVVEVVSRSLDQGLALPDAMLAPRFHPTPSTLYMEVGDLSGWSAEDVAAVTALGFEAVGRESGYFAVMHGIAYDRERGEFVGVADSRAAGGAQPPRGLGQQLVRRR